MSQKVDLKVDWCSYEAAKYAVEHWHYSRIVPSGRNNFLGVWESSCFIGAVVYGFSISPSLGLSYGLMQTELTELRRVAIKQHFSPVSSIIAKSIGMLKNKNRGLRLIVSFADSEHGHIGIIYQAGNWIYVGESTVRQILVNGRWRNDVHANRMRGNFTTRKSRPKHKYLYPLDKAMRKQIEPLAKPYPKKMDNETCGRGV